ncbi:Hypothetical predicted protein [Octopus vulgaris]|uniref:Uncharacterized protein n=1 Tax=Octopus vulgaris TaxID=6645 RepID=A0AA36C0P2_OCTVU|nr:Hypothetical predicted protein [Octopus vulgaris]
MITSGKVSLLLATVVATTAKFNLDNINVNVKCNNRIALVSDLDLYVVARCQNGVQLYYRRRGVFVCQHIRIQWNRPWCAPQHRHQQSQRQGKRNSLTYLGKGLQLDIIEFDGATTDQRLLWHRRLYPDGQGCHE